MDDKRLAQYSEALQKAHSNLGTFIKTYGRRASKIQSVGDTKSRRDFISSYNSVKTQFESIVRNADLLYNRHKELGSAPSAMTGVLTWYESLKGFLERTQKQVTDNQEVNPEVDAVALFEGYTQQYQLTFDRLSARVAGAPIDDDSKDAGSNFSPGP